MTILVEDEQMYCSATNDAANQITVTRGVNGTSAAAHVAAAASAAKYPAQLRLCTLQTATRTLSKFGKEDLQQERAGDWFGIYGKEQTGLWNEMVGGLRRLDV
jgi:hypothetical protein